MLKLDKRLVGGMFAIAAITGLAIYVGGRVVETKVVVPMLAKRKENKEKEEGAA